ncbi:MAG: cytochrome b/b6 domain-containing protein [Campylobacterales bacterium]|nr:cytochrome b/b6 domain-containing protein [Campylobacterales bacterium]
MKKWRADFRLWHWINAFIILGVLGTVFLRKTFLSVKTNSEVVMDKLSGIDINVTASQAKMVVRAIRAPMWEWHIWLGYALAALVVWRIALFFTQSGKQKYTTLKEQTMHHKLVTVLYVLFYAALTFMAVSGLMLEFHKALGISHSLTEWLEGKHALIYNLILYFVPIHILGVIMAEQKEEKGIISDMINGGKA